MSSKVKRKVRFAHPAFISYSDLISLGGEELGEVGLGAVGVIPFSTIIKVTIPHGGAPSTLQSPSGSALPLLLCDRIAYRIFLGLLLSGLRSCLGFSPLSGQCLLALALKFRVVALVGFPLGRCSLLLDLYCLCGLDNDPLSSLLPHFETK